jgi:ABC-type spermidine/putrescine transport system permease subunit I
MPSLTARRVIPATHPREELARFVVVTGDAAASYELFFFDKVRQSDYVGTITIARSTMAACLIVSHIIAWQDDGLIL